VSKLSSTPIERQNVIRFLDRSARSFGWISELPLDLKPPDATFTDAVLSIPCHSDCGSEIATSTSSTPQSVQWNNDYHTQCARLDLVDLSGQIALNGVYVGQTIIALSQQGNMADPVRILHQLRPDID
jgi:hypothetical protein